MNLGLEQCLPTVPTCSRRQPKDIFIRLFIFHLGTEFYLEKDIFGFFSVSGPKGRIKRQLPRRTSVPHERCHVFVLSPATR
jgi:hypothetical protein